jgi:hypothetical protein
VSYRAWFNELSPLRRAVLWAACVFWVIWASWFRFDALTKWSQIEVAAFVLLGAAMASAVIVELARMLRPRWAQWSDRRHFAITGAVWALLFAVQYTGVRMALQAQSG